MEKYKDMECLLCEKPVCLHGGYTMSGGVDGLTSKCKDCDAVGSIAGPSVFCLPTYEGKVSWSSGVYSIVCPECHDSAVKEFTEIAN